MSRSPSVFHTSSALDFTTSLYKGGFAPQYKNMVKSIALLVKNRGGLLLMKIHPKTKPR